MTQTVDRSEVLDYQTYEEGRPSFRARVLEQKKVRRLHVGEHLTFLFENHDTVLYQVQEMMRTEKIVREADIQHELKTYNELLGGPGELGATLLIEIDDAELRDTKLTQWLPLPEHLYVKLEDGSKAYATFDERQRGRNRVSSVQYLKFDTKGQVPIAIGCDFDSGGVFGETVLSDAQRKALSEDLD